ncbi:MAG: TonB-dependent receptor [Acidobacteria bacterium]|nr:TonB-dependent receptor [Acidobacteriota bacterium]MDA1235605.1 TonB-dependent receptor [Acidobacteriota bacterium]
MPDTVANFRYTRGRPFRLNPRFAEVNNRTFNGLTEAGSMTITHFRAGWSSESRIGYNLNDVLRLDGAFSTGAACIRGLPFGNTCGESLFKGGSTKSFEQIIATSRGKHSIKFGGNFLQRVTGRDNVELPEVSYANTEDFFNNLPNSLQVTFGIDEFQMRSVDLGFFVQDDIKVSRNLVVNIGLRWDYFAVPTERDGRMFNRDGPFGLGNFIDPESVYDGDFNNFSPRIGFAYSLGENQKTVLRGGFGAFHNPHPLFGGPVELVRNSLTQPNRVRLSQADVLSGEFGDSLRYPVTNAAVLPFVDKPGGVVSGTTINTNFPSPYSLQWNLQIQRQLGDTWVFETGFVGNRGLKLNVVRDVNQPDRITGVRPFSDFGTFRYYDTSDASTYASWQTTARKRMSNGLAVGFNHTWAKVISYSDSNLLLSAVPQDFFNIRADRGPAPFDITHRFIADFTYELPFLRAVDSANGLAKRVLGGWAVSGILTAETGSPFTVFQNNGGLGQARVDLARAGNPVLDNYRDTLVYLSRDSFSQVPIGADSRVVLRPGNLGRNAIRGPGLNTIDLSLAKNTMVTEGSNLQFRVDMLNAFNHTNYQNPVTAITNSNFGRITGTRGARVVQLYLRFTF